MYLLDNPYASSKKIQDFIIEQLCKYLDNDFDYYCTCEKYYEPIVEDYYLESSLKDWCNKNGFKLKKRDGSGYD